MHLCISLLQLAQGLQRIEQTEFKNLLITTLAFILCSAYHPIAKITKIYRFLTLLSDRRELKARSSVLTSPVSSNSLK